MATCGPLKYSSEYAFEFSSGGRGGPLKVLSMRKRGRKEERMKEPPPSIEEESFVFAFIIAHPSRQICHSDDALSDGGGRRAMSSDNIPLSYH